MGTVSFFHSSLAITTDTTDSNKLWLPGSRWITFYREANTSKAVQAWISRVYCWYILSSFFLLAGAICNVRSNSGYIFFPDSVDVVLGACLRTVGLCGRFERCMRKFQGTIKPLSGFEFKEVQCIKELSLEPQYVENEILSKTGWKWAKFMSLDADRIQSSLVGIMLQNNYV